jgi:hypothetical protein
MPASRSNAIGFQTLQFAAPLGERWTHCYWDTNMGVSEVPNSILLNSSIPRSWPTTVGRGFVTRLIERLEIGWWHGDSLLASRKLHLQQMLGDVVLACAAPLRNSEATKCREILETIERPFVIHLWDMLDATLNSDYAWLFSHAQYVFCLSEPMIKAVSAHAHCAVSRLGFVRPKSRFRARYRGSDELSIALVGFLSAYPEGLELLAGSMRGLQKRFTRVKVTYVGPLRQLECIPDSLKAITKHFEFPDDEMRDKSLADCNVAFIPGPFLSPERDTRSRYSIPCRIADYLAVGLPMLGAIHPDSATSQFLSPIRNEAFFPVNKPGQLLDAAQRLSIEKGWTRASAECLALFASCCDNELNLNDFNKIAKSFLQ